MQEVCSVTLWLSFTAVCCLIEAIPAPPYPALPCPAPRPNAPSCLDLLCFPLPGPALPCPALPCPARPCPVLPCPARTCPALPCPALPCYALRTQLICQLSLLPALLHSPTKRCPQLLANSMRRGKATKQHADMQADKAELTRFYGHLMSQVCRSLPVFISFGV